MYKSVLKEVTNTTNQNAKILSQLHQKPKRDKKDETPVFQNFVPNYTHQADLLYLPTAKYGYKMFKKEEQKNLMSACIRRAASLHKIKIIVNGLLIFLFGQKINILIKFVESLSNIN